jgi:hypothetical protein
MLLGMNGSIAAKGHGTLAAGSQIAKFIGQFSAVGSESGSSFQYTIPPGGAYRFQTDGGTAMGRAGWVRVTPAAQNNAPVGSGVFSFNPADVLLTESGIPAVRATTHARIYVGLTQGHNTGLALANLSDTATNYLIQAF